MNMPCSNTALLNRHEIEQDRLDEKAEQELHDKQLNLRLYKEDPCYYLETLTGEEKFQLLIDIHTDMKEASNDFTGPMDENFLGLLVAKRMNDLMDRIAEKEACK